MLVLPIKKKWFDMIVSGEKKEEYREIKPYYTIRFKKIFGVNYHSNSKIAKIILRNGYSYKSPSVGIICVLKIGTGKKEWGAKPNQEYYILEILEVLEVKNNEQ
jgi:hypothetical protein